MNPQVTEYINSASAEQKEMMEVLRQLIQESVAGVTEEFKWSRPVFRTSKDFTYFKTTKAYLTLGFFDFTKLNDKHNKLQGTGKDMRHIKLKKMSDIDREELQEWFRTVAV
ncbi:DUF1801 domain-containing protein [Pontibacter sp. 13R65]|uniref:DUF1801 domain-containing protein n=1 Tax=Pontibacter sp. 13R65 TaxID=3127458 RepID=UPI00301D2B98